MPYFLLPGVEFQGQGVATPAAFPWNSTDYCLRKDDSQFSVRKIFPPRERFHFSEIDKAGTTPKLV